MYAVTSNPEVRRTLATFLRAEFGFLGVVVYTLVQTPLRWGHPFSAGDFVFLFTLIRSWRISCCIVGMRRFFFYCLPYIRIYPAPSIMLPVTIPYHILFPEGLSTVLFLAL